MSDFIEVEPWVNLKTSALPTYRVDGPLYTIPFVVADSVCRTRELTITKSREKFIEEFRCLPHPFSKAFDGKDASPMPLSAPIELNDKIRVYMHESSSQHMATILSGIEQATFRFEKAEFLVASATLHKISDAVFNQDRSWRLRAFVENVQGRKMIVLCDDDITDDPPQERSTHFSKEKKEATLFAQKICERAEDVNTNRALHGCLTVLSTLRFATANVPMIVFGEVDMTVKQQPANTFVLTGISRTNRASLAKDTDSLDTCFKYLWSRSFWLGLKSVLFGLRHTDEDAIKVTQRIDLTDFFRAHRHRNNKMADVATCCVARTLLDLRNAVQSDPTKNWIVEYGGNPESLINIRKAEESWSFWLAREKFHMMKEEMIEKKREGMKPNEDETKNPKVRQFLQKTGIKLRKRETTLEGQFKEYIKKLKK